MSNELTNISALPLALCAPQEEIRELEEAIAMNAGSGGLTEFELPRIKIGPGAFKIQTGNGTTMVDRIECVAVYRRFTRAYYKSKELGNRPPDCFSIDSIAGHGDPGGSCIERKDDFGKIIAPKCSFAEFESATTPDGRQGKGQACKQMMQLFVLRGESLLPEVLALPPTSLNAARKFFTWMMGQRLPYYKALLVLTVQNAKNQQSQEYGTAVFNLARKLTPEEAQRAVMFNRMCESFLRGIAIPDTESGADSE